MFRPELALPAEIIGCGIIDKPMMCEIGTEARALYEEYRDKSLSK